MMSLFVRNQGKSCKKAGITNSVNSTENSCKRKAEKDSLHLATRRLQWPLLSQPRRVDTNLGFQRAEECVGREEVGKGAQTTLQGRGLEGEEKKVVVQRECGLRKGFGVFG